MSPERHRYKNPPIEEAFCEFVFAPGQEWDLTLPGKLHVRIKDEYPGKPRQQNILEATLSGGPGRPSAVEMKEEVGRVQLVTNEGTRLVGVGKDTLSIHMLRPYQNPKDPEKSGWDEFRPRIDQALKEYWNVAIPKGVRRVGLRYINRIVIPGKSVRIEDYFKWGTPDLPELPDVVRRFINRLEYVYPDNTTLLIAHATTEPDPRGPAFILDIDVIWEEKKEPMDQEAALTKVDDLRTRERGAFEAIITDKTRRLFDE